MSYYNPGNRLQKESPVVFNLIIINVLVFIIQMLFDKNPDNIVSNKLAIHHFSSPYFEPYQVITNMFAHGSIPHILFNMFTLYTFGVWLEKVWGTKRFLIFYFTCGIVAGLSQMMFLKDVVQFDPVSGQNVLYIGSALGASGAIMGLFAAFAYLFPNTELMLFIIPIPIKAKFMVFFMAAIDLFGGLHPGAGDGIGHYAHLGGLLMGFILVIIWNKTNRKTFY
jgi:membrane associated rhomboid family serine protease